MMRKTILPTALLMIAFLPLASAHAGLVPAVIGGGGGEQACYQNGVNVQFSVSGNNTQCQFQHCSNGPTGAAGAGVGTGASKGEADVAAQGGTECKQG